MNPLRKLKLSSLYGKLPGTPIAEPKPFDPHSADYIEVMTRSIRGQLTNEDRAVLRERLYNALDDDEAVSFDGYEKSPKPLEKCIECGHVALSLLPRFL